MCVSAYHSVMEVTGDIDLKYCLRLIAKASIVITTVNLCPLIRIVARQHSFLFVLTPTYTAREVGFTHPLVEGPRVPAWLHRSAPARRGPPPGGRQRVHPGDRGGAHAPPQPDMHQQAEGAR